MTVVIDILEEKINLLSCDGKWWNKNDIDKWETY